jgi:hypothetical protein
METPTFEDLARADKATLEAILVSSSAPDPEVLDGRAYDGYNHDWLGGRAGRKFRKVFMRMDGQNLGVNHVIQQDKNGFAGEWNPRLARGKPVERGFFRVTYVRETPESKLSTPYRHLTFFDYKVDLNSGGSLPARSIRDFVGLPQEGNYDLILGKAYIRMASWFNLFASYFVLKRVGPHTTGET